MLDVGERLSFAAGTSTEKNRFLLTLLTGPAKGSVFKLEQGIVTLGRSDDADIALPDPSLSRIHARFLLTGRGLASGYMLEDMDSTNGTYVAGERITKPTLLTDGVRVGFGKRSLARFALQDELEEQAIVSVHDSALRDPLTRAYNRRVFDDRLLAEMAFSARHGQPLSLLMLDVDHFKRFNDKYGHPAGDLVLQSVARQIEGTLRTEDLFARYGGEEFAVLVRNTSELDSLVVAERIRALVERTPTFWEGMPLQVTISVGVACNAATAEPPNALIKRADQALYRAKEQGRNRVVVFAEQR
ncbi:MAG TPA: GGDEF domain-containing protein [Polyangiaceae bacterium]|nr:GGDEF domain-containing protein [Polyangiaceae bacterium]